jgi:copper ion binding protein
MKKVIKVSGMTCEHCKARVEKALSSVDGVKSAKVDLKKAEATVSFSKDVADDVLKKAVIDAGYEAGEITEKKGFFD